MGERGMKLLLGLVVVALSSAGYGVVGLNIWPMPKSVNHGKQSLLLSKNFALDTEGSKYTDSSSILKDGFSRLLDVIQVSHNIDENSTYYDHSQLLKGLHVVIFSPYDKLQFGIDESYKLTVPSTGNPSYAHLEAQTVYGALHGLQTFSQLCNINFSTRIIEVHQVPWIIIDQPRFLYRGLLIDTARHYQPLPMIKNVITAMGYTKLNVLHWHIVDSQSFPLEIPSYPKLWKGAYSPSERYTMADAAEVVDFARRRGIHVLAEIDVPGHAGSWGVGYPSLWPSPTCQQPLDVSNEFTFKVIDGILSDFSKVFNFRFVHLGGDEVDTSRLNKKGLNESEAYEYFVLRAQKIALSHGYEVINWEETFNHFGSKLNPSTVVHNWLEGNVAPRVVAAGLRCIVSNQDKWYLDHLDATWDQFYMNEPFANITNSKQQKLVIGDIEQTIWPRAAAAAERMWTPFNKLAKDPRQVTGRLAHFRCLLNQRGVAAAPLAGLGRAVPVEPGSCYKQ
ncbi:hypothetical protein Sjap_009586 [Stephania japonica]|uniref:Beta-hexosaminidase n=1 Tax=Stephania japonica TaxID=461633 RepID=A0AAP0JU38_9MAGN